MCFSNGGGGLLPSHLFFKTFSLKADFGSFVGSWMLLTAPAFVPCLGEEISALRPMGFFVFNWDRKREKNEMAFLILFALDYLSFLYKAKYGQTVFALIAPNAKNCAH